MEDQKQADYIEVNPGEVIPPQAVEAGTDEYLGGVLALWSNCEDLLRPICEILEKSASVQTVQKFIEVTSELDDLKRLIIIEYAEKIKKEV